MEMQQQPHDVTTVIEQLIRNVNQQLEPLQILGEQLRTQIGSTQQRITDDDLLKDSARLYSKFITMQRKQQFLQQYLQLFIPIWIRRNNQWIQKLQQSAGLMETLTKDGKQILQMLHDIIQIIKQLIPHTPPPPPTLYKYRDTLKRIIQTKLQQNRSMARKEGRIVNQKLNELYNNLHKLGQGQYGSVWSGQRQSDGKQVAIKIIRMKPGMSAQERAVQMQVAEREIQLAKRIQCAHLVEWKDLYCALVPVYDYWKSPEGDRLYIELQLVEGGDGLAIVRRQIPDLRNVSSILQLIQRTLPSLARSLEHMHRACVLHRDIKPANLLYDKHAQRLYITDYGLSCTLPDQCVDDSGTLAYMDQRRFIVPNFKADTKADVYALGLSLYEMLSGTVMHERHDVSQFTALEQHNQEIETVLRRLEMSREGQPYRVMLQIIRRMLTPFDAAKRPALNWIVRAMQENTLNVSVPDKPPICLPQSRITEIAGGHEIASHVKPVIRRSTNINESLCNIFVYDQDTHTQ